jgi:hypothetical protein
MEREIKQIKETAQKEREAANGNNQGQHGIQYVPVPVPQIQFYPGQQPPPMQPPPIQQPVYVESPPSPPLPPDPIIQEPVKEVEKEPIEEQNNEIEEHPEEKESNPSNLLGYLENLTQFLPEEKRIGFEASDMHLKLETLRAKMSGKDSITTIIEKKHIPVPEKRETTMTTSKVENTFNYIDKLSNFLPDKSISSAMKGRIQYILENMRKKNG